MIIVALSDAALAYIVKQAGGLATVDGTDPFEIKPTQLHQRVPVAMGSAENVKEYLKFIK